MCSKSCGKNAPEVRQTPLTPAELEQYKNDGYVILGRVMSDAQLEAMRAEELRFRSENGVLPTTGTIFRSQLCYNSEIVRRFCTDGKPVDFAKQLVSPNLCLWWNQMVTKMPDGNSGKSEFPWHQDNGYVAIEPATNVTIWIALDDVDLNNGCVWVSPGSHKLGLLDHKKKSEDNWHLTVPVEGDGVPAIMKAGEGIAFTGLTLHRSKLNSSNLPRRAFFIEYADAAAKYFRPETQWQSVAKNPDSWLVAGQLSRE